MGRFIMIRIKTNSEGKRNISINLIPRLNISLIFQLLAMLSSWALHESVLRSILAFFFGGWYLLAWAIWGDSATGDGIRYIIDYWVNLFS